jgi:hypothetical protein
MKHITSIFAVLLFFLSFNVFAVEDHGAAALEHANAAAAQCKSGDAKGSAKHAGVALEHALAAAIVYKGVPKEHMEAASKELEEGVNHGNLGHAEMACQHITAAIEHIQASKK